MGSIGSSQFWPVSFSANFSRFRKQNPDLKGTAIKATKQAWVYRNGNFTGGFPFASDQAGEVNN